MHDTRGVCRKRPWLVELPGSASWSADHGDVLPVVGELLDAVVAQFADVDETFFVDLDGVRVSQLTRLTPRAAPGLDELGRRLLKIENLYTMVRCIGNPKLILFIDEQSLGPQKRSVRFTVVANLTYGLARGVKFLNSIEVAVFADVVVAGGILNHVGQKSKLPQTASGFSANGSFVHQFTFGRIEQNSEVVSIGDHQQPVMAEAHPARFSIDAFGRPPTTDEVPIAVEDLDAAGFVDDEELVRRADCDRAWFNEATVIEPF